MAHEEDEALRWLEQLEPLPRLSGEERRQVLALVGNPAFALFLRYMLAEQQGYFYQLSMLPLGDPGQCWVAAVLQGKTQGIERIKQTLIELAGTVPNEEQTR